MTTLVSIFGIAGRFAGDLLTSALGWASSLLFGRVPRSHQVFLTLMMAGSFLWVVLLLGLLVPAIASILLAATPHPPFVDRAWLAFVLMAAVIILPLGVGLAGDLVPAEGDRTTGPAILREILRGYVLAPVISGLLVFLAGVGLARKMRSLRHGWSDAHIPIVVKAGEYPQLVTDLRAALARVQLAVTPEDEPRVLTLPARILGLVAGGHVRSLRPDRVIELSGPDLRVGVYPSDIAISGTLAKRTRARAAILGRTVMTSAHLTTSAEAQAVEDRLGRLGAAGHAADGHVGVASRLAFEAIDASLLDLAVPADEWDILYRLRLQVERDLLAPGPSGFGGSDGVPLPVGPVVDWAPLGLIPHVGQAAGSWLRPAPATPAPAAPAPAAPASAAAPARTESVA